MNDDYVIREIMLSLPFEREKLVHFLSKHHLAYENDIQTAYGIFDLQEQMVGCGCCARNLLKCFAVEESLRGQNALGSLISKLMEDRFKQGHSQLFLITRPQNRTLFEHCGFSLVAETDDVIMLENQRNGLERTFLPLIQEEDAGKKCGAIVMNCNPFTLGHRALIEYATAYCQLLHIFVVEEDRSIFPFKDRIDLVARGTEDLPNVRVHPSGFYMISDATFPTYFLKKDEDATMIQCKLDVTIFARRIAPILNIKLRFAGEEPLDPVTRRYNTVMRKILPPNGIDFVEVPRLELNQEVISASRVRKILQTEGVTDSVLELVPLCTQEYLRNNWDNLAKQ